MAMEQAPEPVDPQPVEERDPPLLADPPPPPGIDTPEIVDDLMDRVMADSSGEVQQADEEADQAEADADSEGETAAEDDPTDDGREADQPA